MKRNPRYLLLPVWVRVFSWIFLVLGTFNLLALIQSAFVDYPTKISLFGFDYEGSNRHLKPIALHACLIFFGYAGFTLLWGKKEGIVIGLAAGYIGIALVIISTILALSNGEKNLHLELLLQIPFVIALHRRQSSWNDEFNQSLQPTGLLARI